MRLVRRASMLAAFYVLTLAVSAYAECAWVLWEGSSTWDVQEPDLSAPGWNWSVTSAFTSTNECRDQRSQIITRWTKEVGTYGNPGLNVTTTMFGERKATIARDATGKAVHLSQQMVCLPDTVDPRGPKGGGR